MESDYLGSISRALLEGGDNNRERVIARSAELYAGLWLSIARRILPNNHQRAGNYEDAVQETLLELDRALRNPDHPLRSREDIRRLGARMSSCNAQDLLRSNLRHEGQSLAGADSGSENSQVNEKPPVGSDVECSRTVPPEVWLDATEIEGSLKRLDAATTAELADCPELDRRIVESWLLWHPYRTIATACGATVRDVRNTTFDFKNLSSLSVLINELRGLLIEAETEHAGIINRVDLSVRSARMLCDMRDKP